MPTEPGIVTEGLTRRFGELVAVDHVNLRVDGGAVPRRITAAKAATLVKPRFQFFLQRFHIFLLPRSSKPRNKSE